MSYVDFALSKDKLTTLASYPRVNCLFSVRVDQFSPLMDR